MLERVFWIEKQSERLKTGFLYYKTCPKGTFFSKNDIFGDIKGEIWIEKTSKWSEGGYSILKRVEVDLKRDFELQTLS